MKKLKLSATSCICFLGEVSKKNQEILHLTNQNVSFSKNNVEFDEDRKRLIESEKKLKEKLHSMKKLMHEKSSELKIKSDLVSKVILQLFVNIKMKLLILLSNFLLDLI